MKTFALTAIIGAASATLMTEDDFNFMHYLARFNKVYMSTQEYAERMILWKNKDNIIKAHNSDMTQTHILGHNHMSDWSHEEYKVLLGYKPDPNVVREYNFASYDMTDVSPVDWRDQGAVTPVKN